MRKEGSKMLRYVFSINKDAVVIELSHYNCDEVDRTYCPKMQMGINIQANSYKSSNPSKALS